MTCLFGCICNQPEQMAQALAPVRSLLVADAPVARWGLGYVQGGEVLLSRNPRLQTENVDFYAAVESLQADYVIAHASAPDGLSGNANTQPFRFRKWMFAQEGVTEDASLLQAGLLDRVPDFIRRNIKGKTLAEQVFHLFLASSHGHGILDEVNLEPGRACTALVEVLTAIEDGLDRAGGSARAGGSTGSLGNLMVSNGRLFVAACLSQPLYMRRLTVPGPGPSRRDTAFRGILVVSSATSPGEGFEEIPARSALLVSRDVRTDIVSLRP
jgi:hypothetical protein